jgi:glycosyltransferase involved in cell wall biosynthesis
MVEGTELNKKQYPRISIVMPVYNSAKFIEGCIGSVLNQKYQNLEYIVIDGGSTDGTAEIIEKYKDKLAYYVSEKDHGQTHALNKGFARATGDVLAWLNADEEYLPGTLKKVAETFAKDPKLDFLYGQRIVVDDAGKEIGRKRFPDMKPLTYMLYGMRVLPTDACFWTRNMHRLTGCLDDRNFNRYAMDADWLLRMAIHIENWCCLPEFLSKFTEHDGRISNTRNCFKQKHKLGQFARRRVAKELRISHFQLVFGWLVIRFYIRFFEGRVFKLPKLFGSFRALRGSFPDS